jgi:hypothetical protein
VKPQVWGVLRAMNEVRCASLVVPWDHIILREIIKSKSGRAHHTGHPTWGHFAKHNTCPQVHYKTIFYTCTLAILYHSINFCLDIRCHLHKPICIHISKKCIKCVDNLINPFLSFRNSACIRSVFRSQKVAIVLVFGHEFLTFLYF